MACSALVALLLLGAHLDIWTQSSGGKVRPASIPPAAGPNAAANIFLKTDDASASSGVPAATPTHTHTRIVSFLCDTGPTVHALARG
eukprot:COSAG01_NODE_16577_length_1224_cov_1.589333_1_plen_86_part_10